MTKHFGATLSVFALAAVLSGCAGGSGTSTPSAPPASTATGSASASPSTPAASTPAPATSAAGTESGAPASAPALKTAATNAGQVVVDAKGMSVYLFAKDTKDSGMSACTGSCAATWPPVLAGSDAPVAEGVTGKVGTIATPDGKKQLTINGMPVYHFVKDKAPGDITGQGVGGVWYLVNPAGGMITSAAGGY
jgi:predicted lipoprotein with Yx(FWY)xxD motif